MMRAALVAVAMLLFGWAATTVADDIARNRSEAAAEAAAQEGLRDRAQRLERALQDLLVDAANVAGRLAADPDLPPDALRGIAAEVSREKPWVVSVVLARDFTVYFVHPLAGNEAVLGLNFAYRPEFIGGVRRAIALRSGVVTGPARLVQSQRQGLIIRHPIFRASADGGQGAFWGLVSVAVDMENLFRHAGLIEPDAAYDLAIRGRGADIVGEGATFFGDAEVFERPHAAVDVPLPDGKWRIAAALKPERIHDPAVSRRIYLTGGLATVAAAAWAFFIVRRRDRRDDDRFAAAVDDHGGGDAAGGRVALRSFLAAALLAVLLPLLTAAGWAAYRATGELVDEYAARVTDEVGDRVRSQVAAFFEAPLKVVSFNIELARAGLIDPAEPERLTANFLIQLRQQPVLTFVSMGASNGEYYAAGRPSQGTDRNLRILRARIADDRQMRIFGVDDANRPSDLVSLGASHFDARDRPWFKTAAASGAIGWYPPYQYAVKDDRGDYAGLGMGVSAPLYDAQGAFLGVVSADVALEQLGALLRAEAAAAGGAVFLTEADGALLATSADAPIYRLDGGALVRLTARDSADPATRAAAVAALANGQPEGRSVVTVNGERLLTQWRRLQLLSGPALTIGVALPESRFVGPLRGAVGEALALAAAILALAVLIAVAAADKVSAPLSALSRWAGRLAAGEWSPPPRAGGSIRELSSLARALADMSGRLQAYTKELELRVVERTEALEAANRQLEILSVTDPLTGLANRRRFDAVLATECARAARSGQPVALLMLDVDHFKNFNDQYGHQAGDGCLRHVAAALRACARRAGDLPARYGGEEFALIAAGTDAAAALALSEKIRRQIEAMGIAHNDAPAGVVTISIGVASGRGSPDELLRDADRALYRAKQAGRNRVAGAEETPAPA